jgi:hypothetical protein
MAEWLCCGLQIRRSRFDSGSRLHIIDDKAHARVVELVDTRDLKSLEGNLVPVQVRPRAP